MADRLPFEFETSVECRLKGRECRSFRKFGGAGWLLRDRSGYRQGALSLRATPFAPKFGLAERKSFTLKSFSGIAGCRPPRHAATGSAKSEEY